MSDTQTHDPSVLLGELLALLSAHAPGRDLDDEGLAHVMAVPVNCVETMAAAGFLRYHERGIGERKKRRYTPKDVEFNREVIGLVQPQIEVPAVDPADVTPEKVVRGLRRLEGASKAA